MAAATSPREAGESITRVTKEGRNLTYTLTVIQQPERARACGSGAKSSADRRPVDPPPVVELRIFEVQGDQKTDITFSYNANFFLFATLDLARPMAHGRVQQPNQQIPVLTGMPVSGMAYLDRPAEAGYFIFPDLSVRHEGKYRLSFNLYEETKEGKDADNEPAADAQPGLSLPTPNGSFDWRLEVKSAPFTVFSAKKFPGLAESTMLSRTVAEQGCRVRIRRDVRMRRRDGKAAGEFDEFDEEYSRARRTATPESMHDAYNRQRSLSNSSIDRQPYAPERRPSGVDYTGQSYQSSYAASPIAPQSASSGYSHLTFGGSSSQQYQAPSYNHSSSTQTPQQSSQPPQSAYPPAPSYRPQPPPGSFGYQERQPYAQYQSSAAPHDGDYRRASVGYPSVPATGQYPASEQSYSRTQSVSSYLPYPPRASTPAMQPPVNLAPLKMPLESKYESLPSPIGPISAPSRLGAPLPSPSYLDRPSSYSQYNQRPGPTATDRPRNGKRSFDSVFNTSSITQPLHNGMRPTTVHHGPSSSAFDDDDEPVSMEAFKMQYKRADGTPYSRELPTMD